MSFEGDIEFAPETPAMSPVGDWIIDAADLLSEPDPGPTPWLIENLVVDQAIVAAVGRWKTTKSYGILEMAIAIATGRPAFGTHNVPNPGPVFFVNEESGRAALWRRLDALCRGRAIDPEDLRGRLLLGANARIKLDDPQWQGELIELGQRVKPRLYVFDPLARMKGATRDESAQLDIGPIIDFLRLLRDETGAAVAIVHHTGHNGDSMRGSSDLESMWETRLAWKRDGQSPLVDIESQHREAEAGPTLRYRINWDSVTRTMRFDDIGEKPGPTLAERILEHLRAHGPGTTDDVRAGVGVRKSDVLRTLAQLEEAGNVHSGRSGREDQLGRPIRDKVWKLSADATSCLFRPVGYEQDDPERGEGGRSPVPVSLRRDGTDHAPEPPSHAELDDLLDRHADIAGGAA